MIIAHISDTHLVANSDNGDRGVHDLKATIADINALETQPDLIIHSGDVAHHGRHEEYELARKIMEDAKIPYWVLCGNKDDRALLIQSFGYEQLTSGANGYLQYLIDDFPVQIMMLDSVAEQGNQGDFCHERSAYLKVMAGHDPSRPCVAFIHHPPFLTHNCPQSLHYTDQQTMTRLGDQLSEVPGMVGIISGHVHRFEHGKVGHVPALTMSATNTSRRWDELGHEAENRSIYLIHTIGSDGTMNTQQRMVAGKS